MVRIIVITNVGGKFSVWKDPAISCSCHHLVVLHHAHISQGQAQPQTCIDVYQSLMLMPCRSSAGSVLSRLTVQGIRRWLFEVSHLLCRLEVVLASGCRQRHRCGLPPHGMSHQLRHRQSSPSHLEGTSRPIPQLPCLMQQWLQTRCGKDHCSGGCRWQGQRLVPSTYFMLLSACGGLASCHSVHMSQGQP